MPRIQALTNFIPLRFIEVLTQIELHPQSRLVQPPTHYKDHGDEIRDPQLILEMHLYHCLETLRQSMVCHVGPGIVGYKFVRGRERRPFPDFNTPHKCSDWRGMIDCAYGHRVPEHPEETDFVPGEDEIVYEADP